MAGKSRHCEKYWPVGPFILPLVWMVHRCAVGAGYFLGAVHTMSCTSGGGVVYAIRTRGGHLKLHVTACSCSACNLHFDNNVWWSEIE